MTKLLIFGLGYTAGRIAGRLRGEGWTVSATRREADEDAIAFADREAVTAAIRDATHILSSVPPVDDSDPVLDLYGKALKHAPWIGYLSSTGVYGDTGGAWADETAPIGGGRRQARAAADARWQALGDAVRVFRLPGIYGPGRSVLDRIDAGKAHRIDLPGQVFSRVHVDDIVAGVLAALDGPSGVYNLADNEPAPHNDIIEYGCRLLGIEPPPLQTMAEAGLSAMARGFYAENRRIANGKAKRILGWAPRYPTYREGLQAIATR
ncbi:Rossmann-fold NAD(P)-binding domain-containing protein [Parasphingopyxis marina]|uniref:SDR family NAD(P)-dependent oxidoreductase n=1 Tax=Parasphingopyxis marina TaxID=2761622 RepID=A0A842HYX1_9SPHN|nr:SDR family NAD(P)-dependent oxidoreductase [Parasphingopyxis marina]MBC2776694.1 SDR family NAD(P)-dependent oxidoreductase [Parasphingopyxis marina]